MYLSIESAIEKFVFIFFLIESFHHITGYIPIMTQESLMELFAYHSQLGDYDVEAKSPKPEELALFYGIQGSIIQLFTNE